MSADRFQPGAILGSDRFKYGDLYGMSYLPYFRKTYPTENPIPLPEATHAKNINLYTICDSYFWGFYKSKDFFVGVNKLTIAKTNIKQSIVADLDRSKKNILLLEFSERNLDMVLSDTNYVKNMLIASGSDVLPKTNIFNLKSFINNSVFNRKVSDNIQLNLWDYSIFSPIKEFKAWINYKLFNIVDKDVVVASNRKQLFYVITTDSSQTTSSFKLFSDKRINFLVDNLNKVSAQAIKMGFDKVYLTIVPNPVSILEPGYLKLKYNHLTARFQNSPQLHVTYINLIPVLTKNKNKVYYRSDTHWNNTGAGIWLNLFNAELAKY
ncbi:hypothetical protein [Mucilaginibacter sp.]